MNKFLSFYYPTTVVFVDDSKSFLKTLDYGVSSRITKIFFDEPIKALTYIEENQSLLEEKLGRFLLVDDQVLEFSESNSNSYFGLKIDEIHHLVLDESRFKEHSVIVVDYMMPEMDGISFCKKIKNKAIKKIMLTSSKDNSIAIKAFNEGIIDYYLDKNSLCLIEELENAIGLMQRSYFSHLISNKLGSTLEIVNPFLTQIILTDFYKKTMKDFGAVEYYLLDKWGTTLFITYEGIPIILVISSKETLNDYASIAAEQNEHQIAELLLSGEKLLYFPCDTDQMKPASDWKRFLVPAYKLNNESTLFYSLIEDLNLQPLNIENIKSHKSFTLSN